MRTSTRSRTAFSLIALALGVAGGFLLARQMPTVGKDPPLVLLDLDRPLDSMGAWFVFTLEEPALVRVSARLGKGCAEIEAQAAFGPLVPAMRPHAVYEPDTSKDVRFTVTKTSQGPGLVEAKQAGVHAVRIDPVPSAMGSDDEPVVHVKVEWMGGL